MGQVLFGHYSINSVLEIYIYIKRIKTKLKFQEQLCTSSPRNVLLWFHSVKCAISDNWYFYPDTKNSVSYTCKYVSPKLIS